VHCNLGFRICFLMFAVDFFFLSILVQMTTWSDVSEMTSMCRAGRRPKNYILTHSLCTRPGTESSPGEIKTPGFHHMIESLVFYEQIWCRCGGAGWRDSPRRESKSKRGIPLRNRYFTTISSSSVRTVADRHRLAVYHNKHCWRPFRGYQHWWPWTTLNPKIGLFSEFSLRFEAAAHISRVNCAEITGDRSRQPAYKIKLMMSHVSWY